MRYGDAVLHTRGHFLLALENGFQGSRFIAYGTCLDQQVEHLVDDSVLIRRPQPDGYGFLGEDGA